jgi:hypothetical protein
MRPNNHFKAALILVLCILYSHSLCRAYEAINIGQRWELFVDDYLIDQTTGSAQLRLHSPTPQAVVLTHDKAWEGNTSGYHTIFKDGDLYRMYYRGWNHNEKSKQTHPAVTCYAQSSDGIKWQRPNLGLFEFNGSKHNNIILDKFGTHNFTPFKDTNPNCPPEALYKAVARGEDSGHTQLFAYQSPDGIHWKMIQQEPIITEGAFDSQNLAFWNPTREEYMCYFRDFREGYRDIKVSTSKDFIHWSKPQWLDYGNTQKQHLYTNQIQPYYRSPHILIGFPTRYLPDRRSLTEGLFMSSRDDRSFHRWQEAIIRPGQNKEKWYNRSNYIWLGIVETNSSIPTAGTELSIYSNEGYYKGQGTQTRRYTYRTDGFVSIHASFNGGQVITKPIIFEGDMLLMNYSTSAAGSLRVEIQDQNHNPLEGCTLSDCPPIYGDEIEGIIRWKDSDISKLAGKPCRLRFILQDADIYAMGFRKKP